MQLSLQDRRRVFCPDVAFAGPLEQELFKSEGDRAAHASGEVSVKPGSFHILQAENTMSLICPTGKEL